MKWGKKLLLLILTFSTLGSTALTHAYQTSNWWQNAYDYATTFFASTKTQVATAAGVLAAGIGGWYLYKNKKRTMPEASQAPADSTPCDLGRPGQEKKSIQNKPTRCASSPSFRLQPCVRHDFVEPYSPSLKQEHATPPALQIDSPRAADIDIRSVAPEINISEIITPERSRNYDESKSPEPEEPLAKKESYLFERCFVEGAEDERNAYTVANTEMHDGYEFVRTVVRPEQKKRIVLACIHGTFSTNSSFGGDETKPFSKELITFARYLAQYYDCGVEIIPFRWSGRLGHNKRQEAGQDLADQLSQTINYSTSHDLEYTQIWTVAHSHGCNVVNIMAPVLKAKLAARNCIIPITSVHIACPYATGETDNVELLDQCYHFYGARDFTQPAGSLQASHAWTRKIIASNTTNICMHECGQELDHLTVKIPTIHNLAQLIFKIDKYYKPFTDLIASSTLEANVEAHVLVGIKHHEIMRSDYTEATIKAATAHHLQDAEFWRKLGIVIDEPTPMHRRIARVVSGAYGEFVGKFLAAAHH